MADLDPPLKSRIPRVYGQHTLSARVEDETHRLATEMAFKLGLRMSDWLRGVIKRELAEKRQEQVNRH